MHGIERAQLTSGWLEIASDFHGTDDFATTVDHFFGSPVM
jgi:hypothetical protein